MNVNLSKKKVGEKYPTFIIAEAGINHNGDIEIAKKMIKKAKELNVNAIKFQTFSANDMTSTKSEYYEIFKNLEFSLSDFQELSNYAKKQKLIFCSTPFSEKAVDILEKCKVPFFKIASGDLTHTPLLKPFISIGKFKVSIFRVNGIFFQSVESSPKFTLILKLSIFFALSIPASNLILRLSLFFSVNNNLATHLVPFPQASALSPLGLKILIFASISLSLLELIVIN